MMNFFENAGNWPFVISGVILVLGLLGLMFSKNKPTTVFVVGYTVIFIIWVLIPFGVLPRGFHLLSMGIFFVTIFLVWKCGGYEPKKSGNESEEKSGEGEGC